MPKHKPSSGSQSEEPKSKKARIKSSQTDENEEGEEEELFNRSQNADFTAPFESVEAEYGIIEKITVKNFICHGRLECSFGPNVNFVVGRNGSGKSAILTAIVVGLGGKAIVTSRGNSVKNFIKAGKSVAEICIKLRNRGHDAYKPEVFGPSITVIRRIKSGKDGSSNYKILSAKDKLISTKKDELSHIMDHFNIQVDNPVSIMNQETSKNFLLKQSAKDKYKFFLKATQLEQVSNEYREIVVLKEGTEDDVNVQSAKLPDLEKEVLELEQKFKALTCLHDLTDKRKELINQSAWAQVAEMEKERDSKKNEVQHEESREPKFVEKIQQQEEKVKKAEEKHAEIQSQVEILRQRLEELSPQHDTSKDNVQKLKNTVKTLEREIKKITSMIRSEESDRNDILQRIQDEKERDRAQFEEERLERERQITALVEKKRDLEAQKQNAVREMEQFANAVNSARERIYGLLSKDTELTQAIAAGERRLKNLEGSRKNRLKLYGDYMPNLLAEIERSAARFHQKPLGPVGSFLKLKDVRWALGVESCLKRLMYSFCCHDQHDSSILKDIMKRIIPQNAPQPPIITSKFESHTYDISRAMVQSRDFPGFLDIVDVSHPVIFNTLIDQRGVESILLIEQSKDARGYLRHQPPRNCREAFTMEGDQVYAGAEQRYYSSMQRSAKILRGDTDNEISETRRDMNQNQRALNEIKQKIQALRQDASENENLKKTAQRQRMNLDDKIGRINNHVTQLEAEGEGEEETNVADLEEEVQQMEAKINERKEKLERFSKNFKEGRRQLAEASQQFKVVDDQIQELSYQVDPLKDELAGASIEVQTAKQHRKHYEEKKKELMGKIANLKREADEAQKNVEDAISKAIQIHPERLKVSRKVNNIDKEIKQINKRIAKEQKRQGDPEVITKQYDDARENYRTIKKQIKGMKGFVEKMNKILELRYVALKDMRHFIAQRTKYYFITMMSTRGYVGRLKFDHPREELILTVDPGESQKTKDVSKDVRSLSGGERSFSTVCLIMALWESVESPFRAMDEFDVFMDMMNRKICIELMLQFAREQAIRQFIFLTPQDMSKIAPSRFVRITRLHDPERNQGYITAEPQANLDESMEEQG
ncbi:structural maintenance of chromosomes protein 6-like [Lytechinus pictus]|uniref:structural maintenance of chromosomes protein 6-like n=1 Tax=Lytechinus pictus TaxID=7653 RepID=UPI0030B9EE11